MGAGAPCHFHPRFARIQECVALLDRGAEPAPCAAWMGSPGGPWIASAGQARGRRMTMARIDSLLFPAFAWSPGPRQWNSRSKNTLFFMTLPKMQPLACRPDEAKLAGKTDWLSRERRGKEQGDSRRRGRAGESDTLEVVSSSSRRRRPADELMPRSSKTRPQRRAAPIQTN
jgi:hypothetical protein